MRNRSGCDGDPPKKLEIRRGGPLTAKRLPIVAIMTACVAAALLGPATSGASAYSLTGAGSTLIAPLEAYWAADFNTRYSDTVTYSAVGSGAGIAQITARTVDFGASDAPMTPSQAAACKSCIEIPWALTATGISYNLAGVSRVRLTGPVLANIYLGKITNWDAPAIAQLNTGDNMPTLQIT